MFPEPTDTADDEDDDVDTDAADTDEVDTGPDDVDDNDVDGHDDGKPARTRPPLTRLDLRSPRWIAAHVGIALLAVLFVFLGRWQWHSGHRVSSYTAAQLQAWRAPEPVASVITPEDGIDPAQVGQAVAVTGTYDAAHQLLVPGRPLNGRTGYDVLTPLVTGAGQAEVVNRGWLPAEGEGEPTAPAPPAGRLTVRGWASQPESTDGDVNANGIVEAQTSAPATAPNEVSVISPAQLVNLWPYHLPDGYITATDAASASGGLTALAAPLPAHGTSWDLLNVAYAVQWCVFAGVLVGWYFVYWSRELRESDEAAFRAGAGAPGGSGDGDGGGDGNGGDSADDGGADSDEPGQSDADASAEVLA